MLRSVLIVASALVLLAAGAMTATAGNRHVNSAGQPAATKAGAITTLTTGAMLEVKAQNDEETSQEAALDAAKAQAAAAATTRLYRSRDTWARERPSVGGIPAARCGR